MPSDRIARRVEGLLEDARWARDAGDGEQVRALATAVLALDPENAEAKLLIEGTARRVQMTMMFCDVVGSTALSQVLDPEDLAEILREYRSICARAVGRFGGFIEDRQGDGLLIRFGYPSVHEDDARRGVLSALDIVRNVAQQRPVIQREFGIDLQVRIALHTGMVVIDGGEIVGAAPNEAARLQGLAEPDQVLISEATHRLVEGYFETEPRGLVELRGVPGTVGIYAVTNERANVRMDAAASLTPFTGRADELKVITDGWRAAVDGRPTTAIVIIGGPGVGKSRLIFEAGRAAGADRVVCPCSSYHQTTSLHPFRSLLERLCGIVEHDDTADRLMKLRAVTANGMGDLPLLASALSIPIEETAPQLDVDPTKLRLLALDAAARLVQSLAATSPSMLVVEDLHWADESSLDLISLLLATPHPGLLLVLTTRDAFQLPRLAESARTIELGPLSRAELEAMADQLPGRAGLTHEQVANLIDRSDGIPLYLEELVRSVDAREPDDRSDAIGEPDAEIPAALRDSLLARLTSPGVDLTLAQVASTIGRDVDCELLQRVSGLSEDSFQRRLANLMAAGLFDRSNGETIRFRHELIRVVAYETQRRASRREHHSRIADAISTMSLPASLDAGASGFHLERAQRYPEAIDAYVAAAQAAQALGAHKEATAGLTHVLQLVERLPEGPARLITEFSIRQLRSFSAVMAGGYSAAEAIEDHARCVELCAIMGSRPEMLSSLILGWAYYCSQGDLAQADRVCDALDRGPTHPLRPTLRSVGLGVTRFFQGRYDEANVLLAAFLGDPWAASPERPPDEWPLPNDPFVAVAAHLVATLWIGGHPEAALAVAERGTARAGELVYPYGPFSNAYLHGCLALVSRLDGDHAKALEHAGEILSVADRHGFALWALVGTIHASIARVHLGESEALPVAVESVRQWREELASEVWTPYFLTELALAQAHAGQRDAAIGSLNEARAVASRTGAQFYSAETLRIRGQLRLDGDDLSGRDDLSEARDTAHRQHAVLFEQRASAALKATPAPVSS